MSREYVGAARLALGANSLAPSRHLAIHALELAVKAVLAAHGHVEKTHNVGGEFGKRFRSAVGAEVAKRVNKILAQYDAPRYPEWNAPERDVLEEDLVFIETFVGQTVPRLLREVRA